MCLAARDPEVCKTQIVDEQAIADLAPSLAKDRGVENKGHQRLIAGSFKLNRIMTGPKISRHHGLLFPPFQFFYHRF